MDLWLQIPYALNIAILTPVCRAMFTGRGQGAVFQGAVSASRGLELLVGSLWLSILAASAAGLFFPFRASSRRCWRCRCSTGSSGFRCPGSG